MDGEVLDAADVVITMGCGDACPLYPGKKYEDWDVDDPAGRTLEEVRAIRDQIGLRVLDLLVELEIAPDLSGLENWSPRRTVRPDHTAGRTTLHLADRDRNVIPKGRWGLQESMAARSSDRRSRLSEYQTHLPRRSPCTSPASLKIFRWWETVGWLLPTGPTKSQTHTSPSGEDARMLRMRRRTGSASAWNPPASSPASSHVKGRGQHRGAAVVGRHRFDRGGLLRHAPSSY